MGALLSNVLAYKLNHEWWALEVSKRREIASTISNIMAEARGNGAIKSDIYESLRYDCNIIFWLLTKDAESQVATKARIDKALGKYALIMYGFLSTYENKHQKEENSKDYFVAYPITKSPEWYLLSKEQRLEIMSEHISMATSDPSNNGINSYTTTSFGIDDNEFVVLYELNSIQEWVSVTQNLRSARARKWVTNERPILVGRKGDLSSFMV